MSIDQTTFKRSTGPIFEGSFLEMELARIDAEQLQNNSRLKILCESGLNDQYTRALIQFYKENVIEQSKKLLVNRKSQQIKELEIKIEALLQQKTSILSMKQRKGVGKSNSQERSESVLYIEQQLKRFFVQLNLHNRQYAKLLSSYNAQFKFVESLAQGIVSIIHKTKRSNLPSYLIEAEYPYIEDAMASLALKSNSTGGMKKREAKYDRKQEEVKQPRKRS